MPKPAGKEEFMKDEETPRGERGRKIRRKLHLRLSGACDS
jgi:hypothetical protein